MPTLAPAAAGPLQKASGLRPAQLPASAGLPGLPPGGPASLPLRPSAAAGFHAGPRDGLLSLSLAPAAGPATWPVRSTPGWASFPILACIASPGPAPGWPAVLLGRSVSCQPKRQSGQAPGATGLLADLSSAWAGQPAGPPAGPFFCPDFLPVFLSFSSNGYIFSQAIKGAFFPIVSVLLEHELAPHC